MNLDLSILNETERISLMLRACYQSCGYTQFKMRKFEEYDLYARNKDFLVSDNVITFNDRSGKLMALKPDVTLSIVRSGRDVPGGVQKVFYNENVYRANASGSFQEIMQSGLECIGDVDCYQITEVLTLACRCLQCIRTSSVLYVSHLGIVAAFIDALQIPSRCRSEILRCIDSKNVHELIAVCGEAGAAQAPVAQLVQLMQLHGRPETVLAGLRELGCPPQALQELSAVTVGLQESGFGDMVQIDFSIVNDMAYYNGIVFKGYVEGVPAGVLSGGQYDRLMERMGRHSRAIGFAVYLDLLERLSEQAPEYDLDMVLLYDAQADLAALCRAVDRLTSDGVRVCAQTAVPEQLKYRTLAKLTGSEVQILEQHS